MNKFGRTLLVAVLAASMITTPVFATDSLESSKAQAQSEANSLQAELTGLMQKVDELEANMVTKGEQISQAQSDLVAAQAQSEQQYNDMKLRIKYMYEEGDNTALEKILTSGSISELLSQAEYISTLHTYDRNMLQQYVDTQNQITDLKTTLEADMSKMEVMKTEFTSEKENLDATLVAKQDEIANLDEQIQAAAAAAAQAAAEKAAAQAATEASAGNTTDDTQVADNTSNDSGVTDNGGGSNSGGSSNSGGATNNGGSSNTGGGSGGSNTSNAGSGSGSAVVAYAEQFVGNPYVWGGTSLTNGCDCSGFVMAVYSAFGVSLPHSSASLRSSGYAVSYSEAQPGDIICYSGHVGIYVGGGTIVNAIDDAHGIGYSNATYSTILAVRRIF